MGLSLRPLTGLRLSQLGGAAGLAAPGESVRPGREVPGERRSPRWSSGIKGGSVSLSKVNAISGKLLRKVVLPDSSEKRGSLRPAPQARTKRGVNSPSPAASPGQAAGATPGCFG